MLLVQKYLEDHTFGDLQRDHGVYASFAKGRYKFSLGYDMLEAKEDDPLANQCRGLVLATHDGKPVYCRLDAQGKRHYEEVGPGKTIILTYPMDRFFNVGQGAAANINWSDPTLSVLEKLDGTLCIVYYDPFTDQWCVSTRNVPEADLLMDNGIYTFRTLFEKALRDTCKYAFDDYTDNLNKELTYCFELTTPLNRIVCWYPDYRITLLAARNITTLQEVDIRQVNSHGVPKVQEYVYTSLDELTKLVSEFNPLEHEGVVVKDAKFNRVKLKNIAYLAFNKLHDRLGHSERNCLELILLGKDDDVASFLPEEIVKNLNKIKAGLRTIYQQYEEFYQAAVSKVGPNDKKGFALLISQNKQLWTAPLFNVYAGKSNSVKHFIEQNQQDGSWSDNFLDRLLEMAKKADQIV